MPIKPVKKIGNKTFYIDDEDQGTLTVGIPRAGGKIEFSTVSPASPVYRSIMEDPEREAEIEATTAVEAARTRAEQSMGADAPAAEEPMGEPVSGGAEVAPVETVPAAVAEPVPQARVAPPVQETVKTTETAQFVPPALIQEYDDALKQQQDAAIEGAKAAAKQAGAEVAAREVREQELAASLKRQQDLMKEYATKKEENEGRVRERMAAMQSQQIDPQRFFKERGTWSQLSAALSIAAGAYASALTGGPNAALSIVNQAIDRDIDAQKSELQKKKDLVGLEDNLYAKEMAFYNDAQQAEASVRLTQLAAFENRLQKAVASSQNPAIAANAQKTLGSLREEAAKWKAMLAPKGEQVTIREPMKTGIDAKTQLEASNQIQKGLNDNKDLTNYRSARDTLRKLEASVAAGRPEIGTVDFVATYLKQGSFGPNLLEILKKSQPGVQNAADAVRIELGKGTSSTFVKDLRKFLQEDAKALAKSVRPQLERMDAEAKLAGYRGIEDFADLGIAEIQRASAFDEIAKKTGKKVK